MSANNQSTTIGLLLWVLGGVLLAWFTWDWNLPGEFGALVGMGYFALLFWILPRVERYYDRQNRTHDEP